MRIGVIQRDDTRSVLSSSGTLYYMTKALQRHVGTVVQLGPDKTLVSKALLNAGKIFNKVSAPLLHRQISPIHQRLLSTHSANLFSARIRQEQCDVLYAPFASVEIAELSTSVPIVYHTDMTWADALDYYPIYSSLFSFAKRQGEWIQRKAFEKSAAAIFPTDWAANSAIEHYGMDAQAVLAASYGANFEDADLPTRTDSLQHHLHSDIRLLWIGVDWLRKGGPIAYDCLMALLERNVDARLTVCGCTPPPKFDHPRITVVPFLNKRVPLHRQRLSQLFMEATFFVFPTLSEAAAIVLCEACAHGLPSLVPDTGGMRYVIRDGENGFVMPEHAEGVQYADKIMQVFADQNFYRHLLETSRLSYEERLNWDAWGKAVQPLFERVCRRQRLEANTAHHNIRACAIAELHSVIWRLRSENDQ